MSDKLSHLDRGGLLNLINRQREKIKYLHDQLCIRIERRDPPYGLDRTDKLEERVAKLEKGTTVYRSGIDIKEVVRQIDVRLDLLKNAVENLTS